MEEGNLPRGRPPGSTVRDRPSSLEGEHDNVVYNAIVDVGPVGAMLSELEDTTGLRNRVLHNVTWRLEVKQHRVHRVPGSRPIRFAAGSSPRG